MTWNVWYGCAGGCTWEWMAAVCGFAVLYAGTWWLTLKCMARRYEKHNENDEA